MNEHDRIQRLGQLARLIVLDWALTTKTYAYNLFSTAIPDKEERERVIRAEYEATDICKDHWLEEIRGLMGDVQAQND